MLDLMGKHDNFSTVKFTNRQKQKQFRNRHNLRHSEVPLYFRIERVVTDIKYESFQITCVIILNVAKGSTSQTMIKKYSKQ